jgi:molybdopterin molybdotransferase
VCVITTGDETVQPGERLAHGQIYDSNSYMTEAMLRRMGIQEIRSRRVKDHRTALTNALEAALGSCDVVVVVGGVSMGSRDYLRSVLDTLRVRQVFWRVAQKPGKPVYFGVRGSKSKRLVFGLPGNPASAFTCFYIYVYPALRKMMGFHDIYLAKTELLPDRPVLPDAKKWRWLKAKTGKLPGGGVRELPGQGSHMLTSLVHTDTFVSVPPADAPDAVVETYELPYAEDVP